MPPDLLIAAALFATPVLLAALGELVVERAGIVSIGIEGMMLAGALAAWCANATLGPWVAFPVAILASVLLSLVFLVAVIVFAADQIVTGTGINLIALGATALLHKQFDPLIATKTLIAVNPWWMAVLTLLLGAAVWFWMRFARGGLELIAVGESPQAAEAAGVFVNRKKFGAVIFGAACAGLAGAYLSTMRVQGFVENMTQGQGFLALAIVIFGRWNAAGVLLAGLFFGLVRALANSFETRAGASTALLQLYKALPYVVSLIALAGLTGRSAAPAGLGKPHERQG